MFSTVWIDEKDAQTGSVFEYYHYDENTDGGANATRPLIGQVYAADAWRYFAVRLQERSETPRQPKPRAIGSGSWMS